MSLLRSMPLVLLLAGCGSDDATASAPQTPQMDGAVDGATIALGTIKVKVTYAGTAKGQIALGAFLEPEPKTRPPVAFDTSKTPTFPYAAELRGLEPGTYWIVAVLDREPYSSGAITTGAEDLSVVSDPVIVRGSGELDVALSLPLREEHAHDAGAID